jgi:hypothetical protein
MIKTTEISKETEAQLRLVLDRKRNEGLPKDLKGYLEAIRKEGIEISSEVLEWVIQRTC